MIARPAQYAIATLALAALAVQLDARGEPAPLVIEGRIDASRLDLALPALLLTTPAIEFRASPGGVFEPYVGYLIRSRKIATRVAPGASVNSAAALYFAAGAERRIGRGGNACFHRGSCDPGVPSCTAADEAAFARRRAVYLRLLGYGPAFVARSLEHAGRDVWCPTAAEWRAEGVALEE